MTHRALTLQSVLVRPVIVPPEIAAHLMRVTETAHWLEWQDWADPILAEPFKVQNGHLMIPEVPGIGISWNEENAKRYAA